MCLEWNKKSISWEVTWNNGVFPCGSAGKESTCNARDLGLISGLQRSPGEGNGYPLQYSGLENYMGCIVHEVAKSQTQLNDFHFQFQWGQSLKASIKMNETIGSSLSKNVERKEVVIRDWFLSLWCRFSNFEWWWHSRWGCECSKVLMVRKGLMIIVYIYWWLIINQGVFYWLFFFFFLSTVVKWVIIPTLSYRWGS